MGGGRRADGSTETGFACALAEGLRSGFERWRRSQTAHRAILDQRDVLAGEVSASRLALGSRSRPSDRVPLVLVA